MPPRSHGQLLVYVDLVQDIDVLLPVLIALRDERRWRTRIRVARWLADASPRTALLLRRHALPFRWVLRGAVKADLAPSLAGVAALLTAAESTEDTHVAGRRLALRARRRGIVTFTLQHGFENVGLTPGADGAYAHFASDTVLAWGPPGSYPADLPPETRTKLAHVGRPPPCDLAEPVDVAVFENLHWDRYADVERESFRRGLNALLANARGQRIAVRTHPAGGWLDGYLASLRASPNVIAIDSQRARSEFQSGRAIAAAARRVITTPSTVALDAAGAGVSTAIATSAPTAGRYAPLPVLRTPHDWIDFAAAEPNPETASAFATGVLLPGDALANVMAHLAAALAR